MAEMDFSASLPLYPPGVYSDTARQEFDSRHNPMVAPTMYAEPYHFDSAASLAPQFLEPQHHKLSEDANIMPNNQFMEHHPGWEISMSSNAHPHDARPFAGPALSSGMVYPYEVAPVPPTHPPQWVFDDLHGFPSHKAAMAEQRIHNSAPEPHLNDLAVEESRPPSRPLSRASTGNPPAHPSSDANSTSQRQIPQAPAPYYSVMQLTRHGMAPPAPPTPPAPTPPRPANFDSRPFTPPPIDFTLILNPREQIRRTKHADCEVPLGMRLDDLEHQITDARHRGEMGEVKELRGQKRLLRNREAALQSRQRKKHYTERLEEEKRIYLMDIFHLNEEIRNKHEQLESMQGDLYEAQNQIQHLKEANEKLAHNSTKETARLRARVSALEAALRDAPRTASTKSDAGTTTFHDGMDLLEDVGEASNSLVIAPQAGSEQSAQLIRGSHSSDNDMPVRSSILFMILLYGAFFTSIGTSSQPNPHFLPDVSEELQAASHTVLEHVFHEAGVHPPVLSPSPAPKHAQNLAVRAFPRSVEPLQQEPTSSQNLYSSRLADLHRSLTQPTDAQEHEQAFSLTPQQYQRMTAGHSMVCSGGNDDPDYQSEHTVLDRAECNQITPAATDLSSTLARLIHDKQRVSAANVYTRSLLFDEIKPDVVLEFKRLIEHSIAGSDTAENAVARESGRSRNQSPT